MRPEIAYYNRFFKNSFDSEYFTRKVIENFPIELKRFMTICDLGEGVLSLDEKIRKSDPMLAGANCLIETLSITWPPQTVFAGIDCREALLPVIKAMVDDTISENIPGELDSLVQEIPDDLIDSTMAELIVRHDGSILRLLSERTITRDLALLAITNNPSALHDVPRKIKDDDFIKDAIEQNYKVGALLPVAEQTPDTVSKVMRENPRMIRFLNSDYIDEKMYLDALKLDGLLLEFVPPSKVKSELIMAAISSNGAALGFVDRRKITVPMVLLASQSKTSALTYAPFDLIGQKLVEVLEQRDDLPRDLIFFIPMEYQTDLLIHKVIEKCPTSLGYVHPNKIKFEHQIKAVSADHDALLYVPLGERDRVLSEVRRLKDKCIYEDPHP